MIAHISPGHSPKSIALRATIRSEFLKNRNATGEAAEALKGGAVRGLANYLTMMSVKGDAASAGGGGGGVRKRVEEYERRSVEEMREPKDNK